MLLVKTEVRKSPIAGVGLFAAENIKEGQVVWSYSPESCSLLTEQQLKELDTSYFKLEDDLLEYYLSHGCFVKELNSVVFFLDNGRYVNHSDTPNIGASIDLEKPLDWKICYALRDIKKGEELTESYALYDCAPWLDDLYKKYNISL